MTVIGRKIVDGECRYVPYSLEIKASLVIAAHIVVCKDNDRFISDSIGKGAKFGGRFVIAGIVIKLPFASNPMLMHTWQTTTLDCCEP